MTDKRKAAPVQEAANQVALVKHRKNTTSRAANVADWLTVLACLLAALIVAGGMTV